MNKKRLWRILIPVVLLVSAAACGGLIYYLSITIFANPEIRILQPTEIKTLDLSQGIQFTVMARSKDTLHHIDFSLDGMAVKKEYAPSSNTKEMVSTFYWVPDNTGVFTAVFTSAGNNGRMSEPAMIPVVVITEGLSQADVDSALATANIIDITHLASNPVSEEIGEEGENGGQENIAQGGDDGPEDGGDGIPDIGFERPEISDQPPEITFFDVPFHRNGAGVDIEVQTTVEDDHGVDRIFVGAYSHANQDIPIQVEINCGAISPCEIAVPASLADGADYTIIAAAIDTFGQESAIHSRLIELSGDAPAGEGPGIAEEAPQINIPAIFLEELVIAEDGIFRVHPIFEDGLMLIDQELPPDGDEDCVPTTFEDVRVEVIQQDYVNDSIPRMIVQLTIPPCLETDIENPYIFARIGENGSGRHCPGPLAEDMYQSGDIRTNTITMDYCGQGTLQIYPVLQAEDRSETIGTVDTFQSLLCGVKRPNFHSLQTTGDCQNSDRCITVDWEVPDDGINRLPITQVVLIEKEYEWYGINEKTYTFPPAETSFSRQDALPNRVYEYLIYSRSAEGVKSQMDKINIRIPAPNADPNLTTTDWQEAR